MELWGFGFSGLIGDWGLRRVEGLGFRVQSTISLGKRRPEITLSTRASGQAYGYEGQGLAAARASRGLTTEVAELGVLKVGRV